MVEKVAAKLGCTPQEVFERAAAGRHDLNPALSYDYWVLHGELPLFVLNFARKVLYENREETLMRSVEEDD